jgi:DNA invertase Pin-like site-specific DNA recombinase
MRELLVSFMALIAEQESTRRSERVKLGMAKIARGAPGRQGRKAGSKSRRHAA